MMLVVIVGAEAVEDDGREEEGDCRRTKRREVKMLATKVAPMDEIEMKMIVMEEEVEGKKRERR